MAAQELDSFYFKFKNLLLSEKDATLTVKSEAGRIYVSVSVDLGHVLSEHGPPRRHNHRRKSKRENQSVRSHQEISNCAILHGFPSLEFFLTSKIF